MDNSIHFQVSLPTNATLYHGSNLSSVPGIHFGDILTQILSLINIWRFLVVVLIVANFKNFPLIWHVSYLSSSMNFTNFSQAPYSQRFQIHLKDTKAEDSSYLQTYFSAYNHKLSYFNDGDRSKPP